MMSKSRCVGVCAVGDVCVQGRMQVKAEGKDIVEKTGFVRTARRREEVAKGEVSMCACVRWVVCVCVYVRG